MSELDDKLNSILNNPQMMQQIMSLAQSMNGAEAAPPPPPSASPPSAPQQSPALFDAPLDPSLLSKIAGLMQRSSINQDQAQLLKALRPYLSSQKLQKLERAMHAARMAEIASDVIGAQGQNPFSGR